jgi:hypothetical protein
VRSTPRRDEKEGTLTLVLSRTQSAETYGSLLASLRYVNDAPEPTSGARQIALQMIDPSGRSRDVAMAIFGVGEALPDVTPAIVAEDERVVIGESLTFNSDGDFTLYWWPSRLPAAAERLDRARRTNARPVEPDADAAASSYFSAGGKLYRLFDPGADRAPAPAAAAPAPAPAAAALAAANDSLPGARAANDAVWVPGRGVPPPGFERARMLRLEDIFGSDMQDAVARRLVELRLAAGG